LRSSPSAPWDYASPPPLPEALLRAQPAQPHPPCTHPAPHATLGTDPRRKAVPNVAVDAEGGGQAAEGGCSDRSGAGRDSAGGDGKRPAESRIRQGDLCAISLHPLSGKGILT